MLRNVLDKVTDEPAVSADDGPGLTRAISLVDAIVAIAMTVLVLPLVEIAPDVDTRALSTFLSRHRDLLLSFVISFLVIHVFWAAHGTALRRLTSADATSAWLRPLNMAWLLVIVFLPFPTAVVGRNLTTTSAPFYIGTMVVLSALTSGIVSVVDHHVGPSHHPRWAWLTTAVFAACALLSSYAPSTGVLALLLLAIIRIAETRLLRHRRPLVCPPVGRQLAGTDINKPFEDSSSATSTGGGMHP